MAIKKIPYETVKKSRTEGNTLQNYSKGREKYEQHQT